MIITRLYIYDTIRIVNTIRISFQCNLLHFRLLVFSLLTPLLRLIFLLLPLPVDPDDFRFDLHRKGNRQADSDEEVAGGASGDFESVAHRDSDRRHGNGEHEVKDQRQRHQVGRHDRRQRQRRGAVVRRRQQQQQLPRGNVENRRRIPRNVPRRGDQVDEQLEDGLEKRSREGIEDVESESPVREEVDLLRFVAEEEDEGKAHEADDEGVGEAHDERNRLKGLKTRLSRRHEDRGRRQTHLDEKAFHKVMIMELLLRRL